MEEIEIDLTLIRALKQSLDAVESIVEAREIEKKEFVDMYHKLMYIIKKAARIMQALNLEDKEISEWLTEYKELNDNPKDLSSYEELEKQLEETEHELEQTEAKLITTSLQMYNDAIDEIIDLLYAKDYTKKAPLEKPEDISGFMNDICAEIKGMKKNI